MRYGALYEKLLDETAAADIAWGRLRGARVMITGASGLIGSFLTDLLMARNARFDGQIGRRRGPETFARHAIEIAMFQLAQPTFTLDNGLDRDEVDQVVAAAGQSGIGQANQSPRADATGYDGRRMEGELQPADESPTRQRTFAAGANPLRHGVGGASSRWNQQ